MATNGTDKSLGDVVTEVTEKASLLVREEIELAKTEVSEKVTKLGKGAGALAAAGVLAVFALIFFFHALAWFFNDAFDWTTVWPGYLLDLLHDHRRSARIAGFIGVPLAPGRRAAHAGPGDRGGQAHARHARAAERAARPARTGRLMPQRTPAEIRTSIETTRQELAFSVNDLRAKVNTLTDWRRPLAENRQAAIVGAAVAGFVIGGGIAATVSLFRRRR